jgi:hypothetical protein
MGPQMMKPAVRKFTITAHVAFSVGWIGAVAAFLALSVTGLTSHNADVVRGVYLSMNLISRFVIIPLCFAALATGLLQALGTPWGLFRYYWIVIKFGLAVFATFALLIHQFAAIAVAARRVSEGGTRALFGAGLAPLKNELVLAPSLSLLLLFTATALGVYKPWGVTAYGRRKQLERRNVTAQSVQRTPLAVRIFFVLIGLLLAALILLHLTGHGFGGHGH